MNVKWQVFLFAVWLLCLPVASTVNFPAEDESVCILLDPPPRLTTPRALTTPWNLSGIVGAFATAALPVTMPEMSSGPVLVLAPA